MSRRILLSVLAAAAVSVALAAGCDSKAPEPGNGTPGPGGGNPLPPAQPPSAAFVVSPACDDRFEPEPCNQLTSGGLLSVRAFHDKTAELMPRAIGVFMGDLSMARGEYGKRIASVYYETVIPETRVSIVSAGLGELQHGSEWVRDILRRMHAGSIAVLCGNAKSPDGQDVLIGWQIAQASADMDPARRNVLLVGVAADSLQDELRARGSDIVLAPAEDGVRDAVRKGVATADERGVEVHTRVLLVQGTVEETVALVEAVPGFDFAVASRGPVLPLRKPRMVGTTPVYYGGRGMRFGWRISVDGTGPEGVYGSLVRFGTKLLSLGSPYRGVVDELAQQAAPGILEMARETPTDRPEHAGGTYVGAEACQQCHPREFEEHRASAHWKAPQEWLDAPNSLSTACTTCHVTAPFFRGGFTQDHAYEDFGGISCESCHGPGSEHAAAPDTGWGEVGLASCTRCHLPDRTPGFDAKTLWRDFGHRLAK